MKFFSKFWEFFRELCGDNSYEKYLKHQREAHSGCAVLSEKEFYKQETERKWNGVRRCC